MQNVLKPLSEEDLLVHLPSKTHSGDNTLMTDGKQAFVQKFLRKYLGLHL